MPYFISVYRWEPVYVIICFLYLHLDRLYSRLSYPTVCKKIIVSHTRMSIISIYTLYRFKAYHRVLFVQYLNIDIAD